MSLYAYIMGDCLFRFSLSLMILFDIIKEAFTLLILFNRFVLLFEDIRDQF